MGDDDDTRASPARAPRPTLNPPSSSGSQGSTVGSPLEALERDEMMRTRRFCYVSISIAALAGCFLPFLPGETTTTELIFVADGIAIASALFLFARTRDVVQFRRPSTALGWFIPAACVTTAIPYFGAFSPAPIVLVLGIYFVGLGRSRTVAAAAYVSGAGVQGLVAGLVISGSRDTGLVPVTGLTPRDEILVQALVQLVLLATYVTARLSRRATITAVGELERAVRTAAHREALLLEAREELARAQRPGRGRFSEQSIAGYHLGILLGRGAMGEVYEGTGPRGTVAIKLLSQASLANPNHVLRFLRELRTAAAIESPHVVRVLEVGEQPVPFLVMERLEGATLAEILRGKQGLSTGDVVEMIRQVGEGVTAAAAAGIVHRDLKPQNVFRHGRTWKVLDFGVARAIDGGDTLTAGNVVGTPSYMAPEQAGSGAIDHRTDLYALAAIAYRALTSQPPFAAGEVAETLYKVVHTAPRRPSDLAELPVDIDLVLAIGLAKDPAARFQTANELASALAAAFVGDLPAPLRRHGESLAFSWRPSARASTSRLRPP